MPRLLIAIIAVALLLVPASAEGSSGLRLRGTVVAKHEANDLVSVRTRILAVALRVPGSMTRIHVGQRIELRGSTLRARGNGSRVLARNVTIASTAVLSAPVTPPRDDDDEPGDDEIEIKGTITSLSPLTVASRTRSVTCAVPAGKSLAGFAVGDFVEITCDLIGGTWTLRVLEHEDRFDDDDGDRDDDDDDDDTSGHGGGDDDDDDDNSGPGGGGHG